MKWAQKRLQDRRWSGVTDADTYSLYQRNGVWYVDFRANGERTRRSTKERDKAAARARVESMRGRAFAGYLGMNDDYLRYAIERARYRAKRKGVPFGLSMDGLRHIYRQAGGICAVSGHPFEPAGPFRPSLDRINPERGYVDDNVRVVCLIANTAMLHYGESALLELAASVAKNRNLVAAS